MAWYGIEPKGTPWYGTLWYRTLWYFDMGFYGMTWHRTRTLSDGMELYCTLWYETCFMAWQFST
jgi:hypothetical protein